MMIAKSWSHCAFVVGVRINIFGLSVRRVRSSGELLLPRYPERLSL